MLRFGHVVSIGPSTDFAVSVSVFMNVWRYVDSRCLAAAPLLSTIF